MSRVRLELTLAELHVAIAESIRIALVAQNRTLGELVAPRLEPNLCRPLPAAELEAALAELGRAAAASLMFYAVDESEPPWPGDLVDVLRDLSTVAAVRHALPDFDQQFDRVVERARRAIGEAPHRPTDDPEID